MAEEKETKELLSCEPERLGHATYLDEEAKEVVLARRTCIEICLTSNLLCVIFSPPFLRPSFSPPREFELSVFVLGGTIPWPTDANRCSNSRITTSGITLLGTTQSSSVYVLPFSYIFSPHTQIPLFIFMYGPSPRSPTSCRASTQTDR